MKQSLIMGLVGAAAILAGCNDGNLPSGWLAGTGGITPTVSVDASVATGSRALRAPMAIEAADLSLRLTAADGSLDRTWAKVADFDAEEEFAVGDYTFEAFYGQPADEGFDKPYYSGISTLSVRENQSTPVSVTAKLANSMVSVDYTDAFKNYMTDWSATAASDAGTATIEFLRDETRAAYITPGTVVLKVNVTKPNGASATLQAASFAAVARHHYNVTVDISNGAGDAILKIEIDDSIDETVTVEFDLDNIETAPAPTVTTIGFASGDVLQHVEGAAAENPLKINFTAKGGIASLKMTTESASLRGRGWPAEIDLVAADAATQATLGSLGLGTLGVYRNPDKMAVLDLTDVLQNLTVTASGATENTFSFTMTDRLSRTSEPVTLSVSVAKLVLAITSSGPMVYGADNIDLTVSYNGGSNLADKVTFQIKNDRGTWTDIKTNSVSEAGEDTYTVNVSIPRAEADATFRAVAAGGIESAPFTVAVKEPNVALEVTEANTFAKYALVKATGETDAGMQFEYSSDEGASFVKASATAEADGYFRVSGLPDGKALLLRVNDAAHTSRTIALTTEKATQLPDSGMDAWEYEKKGDYQYLWSAPSGSWGTLNALTTSQSGSGSGNGLNTGGCSYKATSGTIPANGRSTQSTAGGGAIGTTKHYDGHTDGNASLHSDKQYAGANAALIRTVGWGKGNTAKSSGSGFGTCQNTTVGELYLGSFDGSAPVYGIEFTSRPSALKFYYHYDVVTAGNGDFGTAEITVYDSEGNVIDSADCQLAEQSSYSEITLPLSYSNSPKAARISVIFKSSGNSAALNKDTNFWRCPGAKNTSGGEYVGSELYIDSIELVY